MPKEESILLKLAEEAEVHAIAVKADDTTAEAANVREVQAVEETTKHETTENYLEKDNDVPDEICSDLEYFNGQSARRQNQPSSLNISMMRELLKNHSEEFMNSLKH